ncbi:unnamed protein product [Rangifer tarandus platyrhynchus]|uniref:Uncharacterized protein n=1 Tax=Rangifer tarandus platyrhynchus TaxID=3082113 RepID=A0ABN8ZX94_RANTA|nr:unnamed protein product [Rangifer tarandus platyrhynchus]
MHLRARVCGRTVQRVTDRGGRVPPPAPRWSIAGAACPPPDPRWASSLWKHISPASWVTGDQYMFILGPFVAHTDSMAQAAWAPACRLDPGALSSLYPGPGLPAPRAFVRCSNRPRAPAWQLPKGEILPFSSMHLGTNRDSAHASDTEAASVPGPLAHVTCSSAPAAWRIYTHTRFLHVEPVGWCAAPSEQVEGNHQHTGVTRVMPQQGASQRPHGSRSEGRIPPPRADGSD